MKNLKTLAVAAALMGSTFCARGAKTVEFEPTRESGEITGLALVNGHLMVRSNGGHIGSVETPYMFVNTNTTDFASAGFTFKEMADTTSMMINNNAIYTTRSSDTNNVYKFTIHNRPELSGVGSMTTNHIENVKGLTRVGNDIYAYNSNGMTNMTGNTSGEIKFSAGSKNKCDFDDDDVFYMKEGDSNSLYLNDNVKVCTMLDKIQGFSVKKTDAGNILLVLTESGNIWYSANATDNHACVNVGAPANVKSMAILPDGTCAFKTHDNQIVLFNAKQEETTEIKNLNTPSSDMDTMFKPEVKANGLKYTTDSVAAGRVNALRWEKQY